MRPSLAYTVRHQNKCHAPTQTLAQITSQVFIDHIKHFMTTSLVTYVTYDIQDYVKCCMKCSNPTKFYLTDHDLHRNGVETKYYSGIDGGVV